MAADPYVVTIIILSKRVKQSVQEIENEHNCHCKFDQAGPYL